MSLCKQSSSHPSIRCFEPVFALQLPSPAPAPRCLSRGAFLHFVRPQQQLLTGGTCRALCKCFPETTLLEAHPGGFEQGGSCTAAGLAQTLGTDEAEPGSGRAGALHGALAVPAALPRGSFRLQGAAGCLWPSRPRQLWVRVEAAPGQGLGALPRSRGCCRGPWGRLPPLPALPLRVTPHPSGEGKDRALAHSPIPVC